MMKVREGSTRGKLFCVKQGVEMVPAEEIELSVLTARIVRSVCAPRPLKQTRYLSSVRKSMVAPVLNAYPEKQTRRVRRGQPQKLRRGRGCYVLVFTYSSARRSLRR